MIIGHYYIIDIGYPNILGFLAPYRCEPYYRNGFQSHGPITGIYKLFNYRHFSLCNVVERCFDILKARFHILREIPNYLLRHQKLISLACCTLHNFIRNENKLDRLFTLYGREGMEILYENGLGVDQ